MFLYPADFNMIARGAGIAAVSIEDPLQCGAQMDRARFSISGPILLAAVVDPLSAPMPAKTRAARPRSSLNRCSVANRIKVRSF